MKNPKISTSSINIQNLLYNLDVDSWGIASINDLKGSKLAEDALRLLPETNSIVILAMEIYSEILNLSRPGRTMGAASFNDLLTHHSEFVCGRLTKSAYDISKVSRSNGLKALPLPASGCPLDIRFFEAVFSYKHAAKAAGLGYIGRSSLLITSVFGPRVRLSCCLTEALLEPQTTVKSADCHNCYICIESCPAQALSKSSDEEYYAINKFACSSFQNAAGGCSECMRLCPANR